MSDYDIHALGVRAVEAERVLARSRTALRDAALNAVADALVAGAQSILDANAADLRNGRDAGLADALLDRLALSQARIEGMAKGVREVTAASDPIGLVLDGGERPNGLKISKIAVPLGVIGIIYEARPNVTSDAAALCLKSGNACILRGGKEAICSNTAIADIIRAAVASAGLPEDCVQLVADTSRESAAQLMRMNDCLDVLIPRGGAGLIKAVVEGSTVPVIETGTGNCHVYVDKSADLGMAAEIVFNAKTSRPSVCNACESLLIHSDILADALPAIAARLAEKDVEIRGDAAVCALLPGATPAVEDDWGREFLDYIISVKAVASLDEAIDHIAKYGTGHSECIVTSDYESAERFLAEVDAASVYVNASTRFTDGGEFGYGAEIGISTQKLHARGPLGLRNLTTDKYVIRGNGQIR